MDTPGFDEGSEQLLYSEILRAIKGFEGKARVAGVLHVSRINPVRLETWDNKLLDFLQALCGRHYLPQITFVTTYWTAHYEKEKKELNEHLKLLRNKWRENMGSAVSTYQHGRASADGGEDSEFLKWYEAREQIAQFAQVMICSRYGEVTSQTPQLINELAAGSSPEVTSAAKCLGISSSKRSNGTANGTSKTDSAEHEHPEAQASTSDNQSDRAQREPSMGHAPESQSDEVWSKAADKLAQYAFNSAFKWLTSGGPQSFGSSHGGTSAFSGRSSGFQWGKFEQIPKSQDGN